MKMMLVVLITGVLLWAFLKAGRQIIVALTLRFPALKRVHSLLPALSFALWLAYAFWIVRVWFSGNEIYPFLNLFLFILLAALFAWFVLKDIVAGLVFSIRRQFNLNHRISFGDATGKIIGIGITHLTVRTDSGDTARIPYSVLSGEVVCERAEDTASDYYHILLKLGKTESPDHLQASIMREVLCLPWVSFGTTPIVRLKGEGDSSYDFEVLFQSLNSRHAARVERVLQSWVQARRERVIATDTN